VLAAAVGTVEVGGGRRCFATERSVVADIDPQPSGLRPTKPGSQHRDSRIVAVDFLAGEDVPPDPRDHRVEQPSRLSDPIGQRGAVEVEPLAGVNLALAIERQMVAVLRHQQMCERARRGTAARGRHRRRRGLRDGIASGAGIFRPDVTDDLEVPGHVVQHLGHVLAELGHSPAALRAGARTVISRLMHDLLPRQMIGQRLALWLATLADRCRGFGGRNLGIGAGGVFGQAGFQFLEPELKLGNLAIDPLR